MHARARSGTRGEEVSGVQQQQICSCTDFMRHTVIDTSSSSGRADCRTRARVRPAGRLSLSSFGLKQTCYGKITSLDSLSDIGKHTERSPRKQNLWFTSVATLICLAFQSGKVIAGKAGSRPVQDKTIFGVRPWFLKKWSLWVNTCVNLKGAKKKLSNSLLINYNYEGQKVTATSRLWGHLISSTYTVGGRPPSLLSYFCMCGDSDVSGETVISWAKNGCKAFSTTAVQLKMQVKHICPLNISGCWHSDGVAPLLHLWGHVVSTPSSSPENNILFSVSRTDKH